MDLFATSSITGLVYRSLHSFPTRRSSDLQGRGRVPALRAVCRALPHGRLGHAEVHVRRSASFTGLSDASQCLSALDRKSTRLNSSHVENSYAVFCLKKKSY